MAQAALARHHWCHVFFFYLYGFWCRRILESPFNEILRSGDPDFPFCLCWANENWSRAWDGGNKHILLEQQHSVEDDRRHIRALLPAFEDSRYIRINGKPLFLVYRTELLPDPARTAAIWREEAARAGIGELYLARVEQFVSDVNPVDIGFDAAIEFAPSGNYLGPLQFRGSLASLLTRAGIFPSSYRDDNVIPYASAAQTFMRRADPPFKRFHCVSPMWDNSARRRQDARILVGSTPSLYENWLKHTVRRTHRKFQGDECIVFINAWNEWAEGCHLEPDAKWGNAYLEATLRALTAHEPEVVARGSGGGSGNAPSTMHRLLWQANRSLREIRSIVRQISCPGRYVER